MEKTEKRILTSTALSILTGRLCGSFADMQEAMDVFYPGIMTASQGSGTAFSLINPFLSMNYIIKQ